MSEKLRITSEEREEIVRGVREEFPTYTTQLLNLANQNAQSTRSEYVGKMKTIVSEFEDKHPEGTYNDWVEFYMHQYDGGEKLEASSERLYEMIEKMRHAMDEIDEEMASRYVRQLVLYKTYMGNKADIEEIIFTKLEQVYSREVTREPDSWIEGYLGDIPITFHSLDSGVEERPGGDAVVIYYRVKSDNSVVVDTHELDEELGTTISDDEQAHRSLSNFSII